MPATPRRVLLVDDDPAVLDTMRRILGIDGHIAEGASGGQEALQIFREGKFDLVVLDLEMPGMRGDELALEIRKIAPEQPIVLLTAYGEMLNAMNECPPGVNRVFGKPFGFETVREALEAVVDNGGS
jgi:CheY-like chemotaxis protein